MSLNRTLKEMERSGWTATVFSEQTQHDFLGAWMPREGKDTSEILPRAPGRMVPLGHEMGAAVGEVSGLSLGCDEFEMPARHPRGGVSRQLGG